MEISFTSQMKGKSKYVHTIEVKVKIVFMLGLKFFVVTDSQSLGSKPLGPFACTVFLPSWTS